MKKLIIINGTMGSGKTTVCTELNKVLTPCVYLDGDWCWKMNPHIVNETNKKMVMDNIIHLLKSFLNNPGVEYVVFCWVIHKESILNEILEGLSEESYQLYKFTMMPTEEVLLKRLSQDVQVGLRDSEILERSVSRLKLYEKMDTIKVDNHELKETVHTILKHLNEEETHDTC